jgi:hypothetical protein
VRPVVSSPAAGLIQERGGRLYVWLRKECCSGVTTLATASEPPKRREFRQIETDDGFQLFVPAGLTRLPDELHIELRRFPRRVEAYWDGCAWVT